MKNLRLIEEISGRKVNFVQGDVCSRETLVKIFTAYQFDAVIHFAGVKSVAESVADPLKYYANNLASSILLCEVMEQFKVKKLVFSSSATVYGDPAELPIHENFPTGATTNPYGKTKYLTEEFLKSIASCDASWRVAILRYFNPVGAHDSGKIAENPKGIPNNLVPFISQVATGERTELSVYGNEYPTIDGTGVRDYIHVVDLASGHLQALNFLQKNTGLNVWNLGRGQGLSVIEMIHAFESASNVRIPYRIVGARAGDIGECWADTSKAELELGWRAVKSVHDMMYDTWNAVQCLRQDPSDPEVV